MSESVEASGRRVLLLHHRKLQRWLQPGGHVDGYWRRMLPAELAFLGEHLA